MSRGLLSPDGRLRELLEELLDTAERGEYAGGFVGEVDGLVVLPRGHLLEGLEVADRR